jgi:chromosome segregation ATPase
VFFVSLATEAFPAEPLEAGQPAPFSGILFNDEQSGKMLFDLSKLPILEETIANLQEQVENLKATGGNVGEQVANLNSQITLLRQQLQIAEERIKLEHDRAEFYREQGVAKDKLLDQTMALNDKLLKEKKSSSLWKTLAIGEILLFIGILAGALL